MSGLNEEKAKNQGRRQRIREEDGGEEGGRQSKME